MSLSKEWTLMMKSEKAAEDLRSAEWSVKSAEELRWSVKVMNH